MGYFGGCRRGGVVLVVCEDDKSGGERRSREHDDRELWGGRRGTGDNWSAGAGGLTPERGVPRNGIELKTINLEFLMKSLTGAASGRSIGFLLDLVCLRAQERD